MVGLWLDERKFMREGGLILQRQRPVRVHESETEQVGAIQTRCLGEGWVGKGSTCLVLLGAVSWTVLDVPVLEFGLDVLWDTALDAYRIHPTDVFS